VANAGDAHAQANAQVALALAAMLLGDTAEVRQALEAAIELEPQNSFALRRLGSLLVIAGAFAAGVARFRQALQVAPDTLINTCNLAQSLLELDPDEHRDEANRLLLRVIEAQPYGELANRAKELRGSFAARDLGADQPEGLRQDAFSYCLQPLQLFEGMDQQRFIAVLSEVAAEGQGGLQINEPGTARSLKNLPGTWSDLAQACLDHVGMVPKAREAVAADAGSGVRAGDRGGGPGGGAVVAGGSGFVLSRCPVQAVAHSLSMHQLHRYPT
jgi:tetratricopeptide (TPR) repeat protein